MERVNGTKSESLKENTRVGEDEERRGREKGHVCFNNVQLSYFFILIPLLLSFFKVFPQL